MDLYRWPLLSVLFHFYLFFVDIKFQVISLSKNPVFITLIRQYIVYCQPILSFKYMESSIHYTFMQSIKLGCVLVTVRIILDSEKARMYPLFFFSSRFSWRLGLYHFKTCGLLCCYFNLKFGSESSQRILLRSFCQDHPQFVLRISPDCWLPNAPVNEVEADLQEVTYQRQSELSCYKSFTIRFVLY